MAHNPHSRNRIHTVRVYYDVSDPRTAGWAWTSYATYLEQDQEEVEVDSGPIGRGIDTSRDDADKRAERTARHRSRRPSARTVRREAGIVGVRGVTITYGD